MSSTIINVISFNDQLIIDQANEGYSELQFSEISVEELQFNLKEGSLVITRKNRNGSVTINNWDEKPVGLFSFGSDDNKVSYNVINSIAKYSDGERAYINLVNTNDSYIGYEIADINSAQDIKESGLEHYTIFTGSADDKVVLVNGTDNKVNTAEGIDKIVLIGGASNSVNAGAGEDSVTVITGTANEITGGEDNDVIHTLNTNSNIIKGGDGDDILITYGGNDNVLVGGAGNDTYKVMTALKQDTFIVIDQTSSDGDDYRDCLSLSKIAKQDVEFSLVGKNLQITHTSGGIVIVQNWKDNPLYKIVFKNGSMKQADIEAKLLAATLKNNVVSYTGSDEITVLKGNNMYKEVLNDGTIRDNLLIDVTVGTSGGLQLDKVHGAHTNDGGDVIGNRVELTNVVANIAKGGYTNSGNASNNTVNLTNSYVQAGIHDDWLNTGVIGGETENGRADNNTVVISGGEFNGVRAARATSGASGNEVTIQDNAVIEDTLQAARSTAGNLENNTITMTNSSALYVTGVRGKATSDNDNMVATENGVTITGGKAEYVRAADLDYGTAKSNTVSITNVNVKEAMGARVRAGNGSANSNIVTLTGTHAVDTQLGKYNFFETNTKRYVNKNEDGSYTVAVDYSDISIVASGEGVVSAHGSASADVVYGGRSNSGNANDNKVTLENAVINSRVYGGYSANGEANTANGNILQLTNSYVGVGTYDDNADVGVVGAYAAGSANSNSITINGGQVANVTTARGQIGVDGNNLILKDVVVEGYAIAGRSSVGNATNNVVDVNNTIARGITGGRVGTHDVDGYKAEYNTVNITDGSVSYVSGGDTNRGDAIHNTVVLDGVKNIEYVRGGRSRTVGDASDNKVTLLNGSVANTVYGGQVNNYGDANSNTVNINGSKAVEITTGEYEYKARESTRRYVSYENGEYVVTVIQGELETIFTGNGVMKVIGSTTSESVYGGYSKFNSANSNIVTLDKAVVSKNVYGGYSNNTGNANGNTVTITDSYVAVGTYNDDTNYGVIGGKAVGEANGNTVTIKGGQVASVLAGRGQSGVKDNKINLTNTVVEGYAFVGRSEVGNAVNNTIEATNVKAVGITGGKVGTHDVDGYKAEANSVAITGGSVNYVNGGDANRGDVVGNTVTLDGGTYQYIRGGRSRTVGDATDNEVVLKNGAQADYVYGGQVNNYGDAVNNTVTIENSKVTKSVSGGFSRFGSVHDNTIIIINSTVTDVYVGNQVNNSGFDNTLNVSGNSNITNIHGASGKDVISITDISTVNNIIANAGDDVITISSAKVGTVDGGRGSDEYIISWIDGMNLTLRDVDFDVTDSDQFIINGKDKDDFNITFNDGTLSLVAKDDSGSINIVLGNPLEAAANFSGITFSVGGVKNYVAKVDLIEKEPEEEPIETIVINGYAIDEYEGTENIDHIQLQGGKYVEVHGLEGNDIISLVNNGNTNFIFGDDGDDKLVVNSGTNHVLEGGDGADIIKISGGNNIDMSGGSGDDLYSIDMALQEGISMYIGQEEDCSDHDILCLSKVDKENIKYSLVDNVLTLTDTINKGNVTIHNWNKTLSEIQYSNGILTYNQLSGAFARATDAAMSFVDNQGNYSGALDYSYEDNNGNKTIVIKAQS